MIELKADKTFVFGEECEAYKKSEADKVIADLIEKNKRLANKDLIMASETIKDLFNEIRHQKYKRCLAMAEMCESMCYWFSARFDHHELVDNVKWELFDRWRLRWAKLADKFKEAK